MKTKTNSPHAENGENIATISIVFGAIASAFSLYGLGCFVSEILEEGSIMPGAMMFMSAEFFFVVPPAITALVLSIVSATRLHKSKLAGGQPSKGRKLLQVFSTLLFVVPIIAHILQLVLIHFYGRS